MDCFNAGISRVNTTQSVRHITSICRTCKVLINLNNPITVRRVRHIPSYLDKTLSRMRVRVPVDNLWISVYIEVCPKCVKCAVICRTSAVFLRNILLLNKFYGTADQSNVPYRKLCGVSSKTLCQKCAAPAVPAVFDARSVFVLRQSRPRRWSWRSRIGSRQASPPVAPRLSHRLAMPTTATRRA